MTVCTHVDFSARSKHARCVLLKSRPHAVACRPAPLITDRSAG